MIAEYLIHRYEGSQIQTVSDALAVEEPLEIRLGFLQDGIFQKQSVSITMRTPGQDRELAVGFLFTEGILRNRDDVRDITTCTQPNIIRVDLADDTTVDTRRLERHFYATSSCGVCGKTSLDALAVTGLVSLGKEGPYLTRKTIGGFPESLRTAQLTFDRTGGIHGAALFSAEGERLALSEDVGRHNAVDKLIGGQFLQDQTPLKDRVLFLSGRSSFELVQKAVVAGIPVVAAVGAPSSLAVDLARRFDVTLIGFVRDNRFNVYHGDWRIRG